MLECQNRIKHIFSYHDQKTGEVFDDLAEQYLVDCAYDYSTDDGFDAQGCAGAWPQAYLEYLEKARL